MSKIDLKKVRQLKKEHYKKNEQLIKDMWSTILNKAEEEFEKWLQFHDDYPLGWLNPDRYARETHTNLADDIITILNNKLKEEFEKRGFFIEYNKNPHSDYLLVFESKAHYKRYLNRKKIENA